MLSWITANLSTIIVSIILLGIIVGIVVHMIKQKKQGKSSCGCNCSGCAMSGSCHPSKEKK